MSGAMRFQTHAGPNTYEVAAVVKGGMLVMPNSTTPGDKKVKPATAGATTVLGVAIVDARPYVNPVTTDADGFELVNVHGLPQQTTVEFGRYPVIYGADCAFGKALKAGANGVVVPWVSGTDAADLIVGYCDEPGGVVVASRNRGIANISR